MTHIVVYCSSASGLDARYTDTAVATGRIIGSTGCALLYGGVNAGMMHITAQSAADNGAAEIIGVIPEVFAHRADPLLTVSKLTRDLAERKQVMIDDGDIFVVLPGGIGTIDEWISTLSHFKVVREQHRHIVVVNIDGAFDAQLSQLAVTAESVFTASIDYMNRMSVVTDIDQLEKVLTERIHSYEKE